LKSILCRLSLAVSLTVCGVAYAAAAPISIGGAETWFYDGASAGCPNCRATVTFELLTSTSLRITLENTSTDNRDGVNILTAIGFDTTSTLTGLALLSRSMEGGPGWALGNGVGSGGWEVGLVTERGINGGLDNQSNLEDSGSLIIGWSQPIGPAGLTVDRSTTKFQNSEVEGQSVHPAGSPELTLVTVPEPGTMFLVGAGLIGMRRLRSHSSIFPGDRMRC
jgi:hypothetical protein